MNEEKAFSFGEDVSNSSALQSRPVSNIFSDTSCQVSAAPLDADQTIHEAGNPPQVSPFARP